MNYKVEEEFAITSDTEYASFRKLREYDLHKQNKKK